MKAMKHLRIAFGAVCLSGSMLALALAVALSSEGRVMATHNRAVQAPDQTYPFHTTGVSTHSLAYRGFNYVTWQPGRYPFSTSWMTQTYSNSQAIRNVTVSSALPFSGRGALAMSVDLRGGHPNLSQGEVFVDVRYYPPLCSATSFVTAPLNLEGMTISARVYAPPGSLGDSLHPNGLQLFVKDSTYDSNYGPWFNIIPGAWNIVTATIHSSGTFEANHVVLVGLKIGAGTGSTAQFRGIFQLDDYGWPGGCYPQYRFEYVGNALDSMRATGANAVALIVTWYTPISTSNTIEPKAALTPTDAEIERTIQEIHQRGMAVLLKPHLDVLTGEWRGLISPDNPAQWFVSYTQFITHYASIAQRNQVEMFAVGTELRSMVTTTYQAAWNTTLDAIEATYVGPLVYAANWDDYSHVPDWYWARMDKAGIDAYFPLSDKDTPTLQDLINGWLDYSGHNWVQEVMTWQQIISKPMLFTEIGYPSYAGSTQTPWASCDRLTGCSKLYDGELQARAYEAALQVWRGRPWFEGLFWWLWDTASDAGGPGELGFTPQNKPVAGELLSLWGFRIYLPVVIKAP